jgi:MoxR-like ATPase
LIRKLVELCGADPAEDQYFEWLLSKHTTPEELFGPPDIKKLTDPGVFQRKTEGKLPKAQIAFLDEIFRGSSMILNTLLTVVNEKHFHDGKGYKAIPLLGIVGASNLPPAEPELEAFFDRFPIRVWLDSLLGARSEVSIEPLLQISCKHSIDQLTKEWAAKSGTGESGDAGKIHACMHDIRGARALLYADLKNGITGSDGKRYFAAFGKAARLCRVSPSDRTFGVLWKFGRALEFFRSELKENGMGPIEALRYIGATPEERRNLGNYVNELQGSHTTYAKG